MHHSYSQMRVEKQLHIYELGGGANTIDKAIRVSQ